MMRRISQTLHTCTSQTSLTSQIHRLNVLQRHPRSRRSTDYTYCTDIPDLTDSQTLRTSQTSQISQIHRFSVLHKHPRPHKFTGFAKLLTLHRPHKLRKTSQASRASRTSRTLQTKSSQISEDNTDIADITQSSRTYY
jgi:hypothetical protein